MPFMKKNFGQREFFFGNILQLFKEGKRGNDGDQINAVNPGLPNILFGV